MPNKREIKTCSRCRHLKVRCDRTRPSCQRCTEATVSCSFLAAPSAPPTSDGVSTPATEETDESIARSSLEELLPPISQGGGASAVKEPKITRRRRRAHLSCTRCFRLKVKCDKELPCSRCRLSGWGRCCAYNYRVESNTPSSDAHPQGPAAVLEHDAERVISSWHAQRRGATHWEQLLSHVKQQAGRADILVCHQIAEIIREKNDKQSGDYVLPCNFPFNSPAAARFVSLDAVCDLLQSHREMCQSYIDGYMAIYQQIHPIIDVPQFHSMVHQVLNDPKSAEISWLASFLMVLALGCFAVTRDPDSTAELCMAAEACLSKTTFMVSPSLETTRTLCLMVIAKQTMNTTCRTFDSCWAFLGIVIRAAVGISLDQQPEPHGQSVEAIREWQCGKALWSLIVYFCIHTAAITGKPPLIGVDDITTKYPLPSCPEKMADPWLLMLAAYPKICHIIARVNSDNKPSYDEIRGHNDQLRQFMMLLDNIHRRPLLYVTLDIFFRRLLLALHRPYALHHNAPFQYSVSYWSSLECSLAILVHHRNVCEHGGRDSGNIDILSRLFKLDFFSAMLTVCIHLLRHDAPLATGFAIPPRLTILDTLRTCTELWGEETHNSVCFKIGHRLLTSVLEVLSNADRSSESECQPSRTLYLEQALS